MSGTSQQDAKTEPESQFLLTWIIKNVFAEDAPTGLSRTVLPKSTTYKLFWSLIYAGATIGLLVNFSYVATNYFEFKTLQITITQKEVPDFPDVTVCSNNPFSSVPESPTARRAYNENEEFRKFRDQLAEDNDDMNLVKSLYYISAEVANTGLELMSELGPKPDNIIVSCKYKNYNCSSLGKDSIKVFVSATLTNCFTFSGSAVDKQDMEGGVENGLSLILHTDVAHRNTNSHYYMGNVANQDGIVVAVSQQNTVPDNTNSGFDILPGMSTSVSVRLKRMRFMKKPYDGCQSSKPIHVGNYSYSESACEKVCVQEEVLRNCSCLSAEFLIPDHASDKPFCGKFLPEDTETFLKKKRCELTTIKGVKRDYKTYCSRCQKMCVETYYNVDTSQAKWPREFNIPSFLDKFIAPATGTSYHKEYQDIQSLPNITKLERNLMTSNWIKTHLYRLNVYFRDFVVTEIRQIPKVTRSDLFSSVGGVMGFWLGLSIINGIDIVEFLVMFCKTLLNQVASNTVVAVTKQKHQK